MNEGYAPWPVEGLPLVSRRLTRSLGFGFGFGQQGAEGGGGGLGGFFAAGEEENGGVSPGQDRGGTRRRRRASAESGKIWGKFLALSVDVPQGLCAEEDGCSRVWMYGSEAWGALRERCRAGLAAEAAAVGGGEGMRGGFRRRQGELEPLEVACAVGDVAGREGSEWGLDARRVCGAGPRGNGGGVGGVYRSAGGGKWERARVWEVYPL